MTPTLQTALWISHPILEIAVAISLFARKRHRTFPVFFTYITAQAVMFCILFPAQKWGGYMTYFYVYWVCAAVSLMLGFKVIYEIFLDVFNPYHALKDLGGMLFKWSGLVMLLVAIVIAAATPSSGQGWMQAIIVAQRGVRVIQCGLILFLLVFSKHLGISWKQNSFGIALGFGFYAAVELGTFALFSSGRESEIIVGSITSISYCIAASIWLSYALFKTFPREVSANLLTSLRWNQSLGDLQRGEGDGSLIPMFEGMVDRAFSRAPGKSFMMSSALEKSEGASSLAASYYSPIAQTATVPPSFSVKI